MTPIDRKPATPAHGPDDGTLTSNPAPIGGEQSQERQYRDQGEQARRPAEAALESDPDYPATGQPDAPQSELVDRPAGESASVRSQGQRPTGANSKP